MTFTVGTIQTRIDIRHKCRHCCCNYSVFQRNENTQHIKLNFYSLVLDDNVCLIKNNLLIFADASWDWTHNLFMNSRSYAHRFLSWMSVAYNWYNTATWENDFNGRQNSENTSLLTYWSNVYYIFDRASPFSTNNTLHSSPRILVEFNDRGSGISLTTAASCDVLFFFSTFYSCIQSFVVVSLALYEIISRINLRVSVYTMNMDARLVTRSLSMATVANDRYMYVYIYIFNSRLGSWIQTYHRRMNVWRWEKKNSWLKKKKSLRDDNNILCAGKFDSCRTVWKQKFPVFIYKSFIL